MADCCYAITNTYPPLTPINCRFFFVEGEPGSPSAFRFIIDLRDNWGDEARKDTSNYSCSGNMMWSEDTSLKITYLS